MTPRLPRVVAMVIAAAAVVDPVVMTSERVRPIVALGVEGDAGELRSRVVAALADRFVVRDGHVTGAAAIVVAGGQVPVWASADYLSSVPAFAVHDDTPGAVIAAIHAPVRASSGERVPVTVGLGPWGGAESGAVDIELEVGGTVMDRRTVAAESSARSRDVELSFVPVGDGPHHVRVRARHGQVRSSADTLVTVVDRPWRVLFHDGRPTWASTFVRRALEGDARFDVAARVATARQAAVASGKPPASLADALSLRPFDAIVIGAPGAGGVREREALEAFLRRRGGSVVVLLDDVPNGSLPGAGALTWEERLHEDPVELAAPAGRSRLLVSELAMPRALPPGAGVLAAVAGRPGDAVLWDLPVGAGRLVVSGALDAWRYRGSDASGFDRFWRDLVAGAARRAPAPIEVELSPRIVRPGVIVRANVTLRDLAPGGSVPPTDVAIRARLDGEGLAGTLRMWPAEPGRLVAEFRAPGPPGAYRLTVEAGSDDPGFADVLVSSTASTPAASPDRIAAWASSRGSAVIPASLLEDPRGGLVTALDAAVPREATVVPWRPMRSAWWIAPFALALGVDWWLGRRQVVIRARPSDPT